jgi:uncharacterized damage-inducible protein DinB
MLMITTDFVRTMAAYNTQLNAQIYAAAARLPDETRRADRGAFWRSIHGTLSHLVWGDQMWMSRFDGWDKPDVLLAESDRFVADFDVMHARRIDMDGRLQVWAAALDPAWLAGEQHWFSGATKRDICRPRSLLVAHMFNHQTHHRGQAHALLTSVGQSTGDTDLWLVG